jgi:hypothetical protein
MSESGLYGNVAVLYMTETTLNKKRTGAPAEITLSLKKLKFL